VEYFSARKFASTINVPGLVIHDEHDEETSVQHSINICNNWKKSRLQITKGLGHNLKSKELIEEVRGFINEESSVPAGKEWSFKEL
jgi:hypothetical protein